MSRENGPGVIVGNGPTLASACGLLSFQAFLKAVAVAVEFQDMAVVSQAVEERSCQPLITEYLQPPAKLQV